MHRRIEIAHVDAFTRTRFAGNPAAVVLDAERLTEDEIRAIARELGHIDSAFVLPPDAADHDLRLRFFTPRGETAFIGHATLAVHTALRRRASKAHRVQKQKSGLVDIEVRGKSDGDTFVSFRQPAATLGRTLEPAEGERVLAALGIPASELDERCPLQIAGGSSTRLLIGLESAAALATITPDLPRLIALSPQIGAAGYFVFSFAPELDDVRTEARMFAPALGIDEDPVSGNAHGMLAAYGFAHGVLTADELTVGFTCAQGHHMGRAGQMTVHGAVADGVLQATRIGGHAVLLYEAALDLPT